MSIYEEFFMIKKIVISGMIALVLLACSSKESQSLAKAYEQKQNYYKYLQKTEKLQLQENNITKVLVTATYMNQPNIDNDDTSDEVFLIGLYKEESDIKPFIDDGLSIRLKDVKTKKERRKDGDEARQARQEKIAQLRMNDQNVSLIRVYDREIKKEKKKKAYLNPTVVQVVNKDNALLKGISFVSDWNQFYLVHFKHIAGNRLQLQVKSEDMNLTGTLNFAKVAKYAL